MEEIQNNVLQLNRNLHPSFVLIYLAKYSPRIAIIMAILLINCTIIIVPYSTPETFVRYFGRTGFIIKDIVLIYTFIEIWKKLVFKGLNAIKTIDSGTDDRYHLFQLDLGFFSIYDLMFIDKKKISILNADHTFSFTKPDPINARLATDEERSQIIKNVIDKLENINMTDIEIHIILNESLSKTNLNEIDEPFEDYFARQIISHTKVQNMFSLLERENKDKVE